MQSSLSGHIPVIENGYAPNTAHNRTTIFQEGEIKMKWNTSSRLLMAAIVLLLLTGLAAAVQAQMTFTVTNTNNSGTGSLKKAIDDSNANPPPANTQNKIVFNISGTGPFTIKPLLTLPTIKVPTDIDATTQPGFQPNTLDYADNEVPMIILTPGSLGALVGFTISASNCSIEGFVINKFPLAISLTGPGGGNVIKANFIGTDNTGKTAAGNLQGILINKSANNIIGGDDVDDRNIISANTASNIAITDVTSTRNGIYNNFIGPNATGTKTLGATVTDIFISAPDNYVGMSGLEPGEQFHPGNVIAGAITVGINLNGSNAYGNEIEGNKIGTDPTGTQPLPNTVGVLVDAGAHDNEIGELNVIAFNLTIGVVINGANTVRNTITENSIFGNLLEGIQLLNGANDDIKIPLLISAAHTCSGCGTEICGTYIDPDRKKSDITVELFMNDVVGPPNILTLGLGQGKVFITSYKVKTDFLGVASLKITLPIKLPVGKYITATVTDDDGNTSAFSNDVVVLPAADLSIVKTVNPCKITAGTNGTFIFKVTNNGPEPVTGATIVDILPLGTTYLSAYSNSPYCTLALGNFVCITFTTPLDVGETRTAAILFKTCPDLDDGATICDTALVISSILGDIGDIISGITGSNSGSGVASADIGSISLDKINIFGDCNICNNFSKVCFRISNPCKDAPLMTISTDLLQGNPIPLPGCTDTWYYRVIVRACTTTIYGVTVTGNAPGLMGKPISSSPCTVSTSGSNVTWQITSIKPCEPAVLIVCVKRTVPANTPCDSLYTLTGQWTAKAYAVGTQTSAYSNPITITATCQ